jgi:hypothetical protein
MKVICNQKYIDKNVKITKYITWASLAVLGTGIYLSITQNEETKTLFLTFGALLVGFTLSQISIFMQNRWGKSPRPDELITSSLKGLDDKYTLYIYSSPLPNLLVSPNGIWGFITYPQQGKISYSGGKWKHKGGNSLRKIFAGDSIGKPNLDYENLVSDYSRGFAKKALGVDLPELNVALVFTHPTVEINADEAPIPAIQIKKIKDMVRKRAKTDMIPLETIDEINKSLSV